MNSTSAPPLLTGMRPAHWLTLDAALAIAYSVPTLLLLVNLAFGMAGALVIVVGVVAFAGPIAIRRSHPVAALCVLLSGLAVVGLMEPKAVLLGLLPMAYVLYTVAVTTRPMTAGIALVASVGAAWATALPDFRHVGAAVPFSFLFIVVWMLGIAVGLHRRYTQRLLAIQVRLVGAEREAVQQKVVQERIRIARDLHDIVAHGMSVITVQAGYGNLVLDDEPEVARAALRTIETVGRQTLNEMRQLVTILRPDSRYSESGTPDLSPAPGLAQLGDLLQQTSTAGLHVDLRVSGSPRALPGGIDLAVYRVVQEALTNALKHADTDSAQVTVDFHEDALAIGVIDDGRGCPGHAGPVPGYGMTGMQERVHLYGGTFRASAVPGGGFSVNCRLPLPDDHRRDVESATADADA